MMRTGRRLLPVLLLVTACVPSGPGPSPKDPGLDHTTASTRAAAPAPVDPASGVLTQAWRTDLRSAYAVRYVFAAGQLLVVTVDGVDAIATADGAARWHYRMTGRELAGHAITGGALVLLDWGLKDDPRADPRAVALDAATGKRLWTSTDYHPVNGDILPSGRGIVAMADGSELVGLDARTGKSRWTWPGPPRASGEAPCRYVPHDSDGAIMLIQTECGRDEALYALDPGTGRPVWLLRGPAEWATSRAGLTLVSGDVGGARGVALLGRDGRVLSALEAASPAAGSLVVTGGRAVVTFGKPTVRTDGASETVRNTLAILDARTGRLIKRTETRIIGALAVARGRVHGMRDHLGSFGDGRFPALLPAGLDVLDPATGRVSEVPLPSAAAAGFWSPPAREPSGATLLDGGRVYTAVPIDGGLRLTAYRPGAPAAPPETGGVDPKDWPDACELLDGVPKVESSVPLPDAKIGERTVPGWHCQYYVPDEHPRQVTVHVAWVARDSAEADRMLDPDGGRAEKLDGLGDEAYRLGSPNTVALRVGRYIVVVEDYFDLRPAEAVVRNLKRLG